MKDKYYGFFAGLIAGDTVITSKTRGYSDNTAVFLVCLDYYISLGDDTENILSEIRQLYKEKSKHKYASCISHTLIKPSLYTVLYHPQEDNKENIDYSVIFRGMIPFLLFKFKQEVFSIADFKLVQITHSSPEIYSILIFLCKLFNLIYTDKPKDVLYKFTLGKYPAFILSLPIQKTDYACEVIRSALKMFYETETFAEGLHLCTQECKPIYGMIAGAFYGFKELHNAGFVKIDNCIMQLINQSYIFK